MRAYFLALQYWLAGSEENLANMVRLLVDRYADGTARAPCAARCGPRRRSHIPMSGCIIRARDRPDRRAARTTAGRRRPHGTVGLLLLRSYVLAGNAAHYDGVIDALEAKGLRVIPAFASGLDAAPGDRALLHARRHGRRSTRWSR